MSKGSGNRTRKWKAYRDNYDRIFRPKAEPDGGPVIKMIRGVFMGEAKPACSIDDRKSDYICADCATQAGGLWPDGHVATFHEGACGMCGCKTGLACVGDWNWPDKKARGMRD